MVEDVGCGSHLLTDSPIRFLSAVSLSVEDRLTLLSRPD